MLDNLFLQVLNMSFTGSVVILFVLVARLLLKKAPKSFSYALWGIVLFRLICPLSFESVLSLLPTKANPISQDIVYQAVPKIDTGISAINNVVNTSLPAATPAASANPLQIWIFLGEIGWLIGIAFLVLYSVISLFKLKRQLRGAYHERDNIYIAGGLETAFVVGLIRPKIYLPANLADEEKRYILLHEETHIKRFDHLIRILSFFVLCLHWFNPLVWVAFFISGKDMEMSCDEAVIKKLGNDVKKEYSTSLLALATGRRLIGGTPLAFGEGDTKGRIKNVLNYKKPAFWIVTIATIAIITMAIGLTTNPINSVRLPDAEDMNFSLAMLDRVSYGALIAGEETAVFPKAKSSEVTDFLKELRVSKKEISKSRSSDRDSSNQLYLAYEGFGDDGTIYDLYFNFNADFTEVWLDNDVKPSFSYRVKKPEEAKIFFGRQFVSIGRAPVNGFVEELWQSRTKYLGDNSAVGKLLGLMPLPEGLRNDHYRLYTNGAERGLDWWLDEENGASYRLEELNRSALLLFALIDNLEDFYITTKTPFDTGTRLHYNREWANQQVDQDVRNYTQNIEKFQELFVFLTGEIVPAQYSIAKPGKDGHVLYSYSPKSKEIAEAIISEHIIKPEVLLDIDTRTKSADYLIRQQLTPNESFIYPVYLLEDGTAILRSRTGDSYTKISDEIYSELIRAIDEIAK